MFISLAVPIFIFFIQILKRIIHLLKQAFGLIKNNQSIELTLVLNKNEPQKSMRRSKPYGFEDVDFSEGEFLQSKPNPYYNMKFGFNFIFTYFPIIVGILLILIRIGETLQNKLSWVTHLLLEIWLAIMVIRAKYEKRYKNSVYQFVEMIRKFDQLPLHRKQNIKMDPEIEQLNKKLNKIHSYLLLTALVGFIGVYGLYLFEQSYPVLNKVGMTEDVLGVIFAVVVATGFIWWVYYMNVISNLDRVGKAKSYYLTLEARRIARKRKKL